MSSLGGSRSTFCLGSKDIVFGFIFLVCVLGGCCLARTDNAAGCNLQVDVDDVDRTPQPRLKMKSGGKTLRLRI